MSKYIVKSKNEIYDNLVKPLLDSQSMSDILERQIMS